MFKTTIPKLKDMQKRFWHVHDAAGQVLGRLATQIAQHLRGKHKPLYKPGADLGDHVVVTNTDQIACTGNKLSSKIYYKHTGFPGGLKAVTLAQQMAKDSRKVIHLAVKRMIPKGPLRNTQLKRLKLYPDDKHPHTNMNIAQNDVRVS